jgi:hypothetical protein
VPQIASKWKKRHKNNQKIGFMLFFPSHFGTIWAPQNGPKKVPKGPQVSRTYGPTSELKNKPLTKLLGHSFKRNGEKQPENRFLCFFYFGAIWTPPNGSKKIPKGLQVGKTYGPIFKLENKPLKKLSGPFLLEKLSKTTRKQVFMLFFSFWGHLGTSKRTQKGTQMGAIGQEVWPNV